MSNESERLSIDASFDRTQESVEHWVEINVAPTNAASAEYLAGRLRVETTHAVQSTVTVPWSAACDPKPHAESRPTAGVSPLPAGY